MCVKQSSQSRSRFLQARRSWPSSVSLLSLLLLALTPWRINSEPIEQKPTLQNIETSLIGSLSDSAKLRQALKEQRGSRHTLETAFGALKEQLRTSEENAQNRISELETQLNGLTALSDSSQAEISRLTGLLTASREESERLSKAFEDYKANRDKDILDLQGQRDRAEAQANIFRGLSIAGGVAAVGVAVAWVVVDVVIPWAKSLLKTP